MSKTIADLIAETLASAGVERVWGVTGDSLNGLNESLHRVARDSLDGGSARGSCRPSCRRRGRCDRTHRPCAPGAQVRATCI
jgi:hypothetical protein